MSLFEIGRVNPGGGDPLPDEHEHLAVILAGQEATAATTLWRRLARNLAVANPAVINEPVRRTPPRPVGEGSLANGQPVGVLGEIDPQVLDAYEIAERVAWLELDLGTLLEANRGLAPYRAPSRYPSSDIDLAFTVPDIVSADEVAATIAQAGGDLLASVALFDVFRSDQLGEDRRSLAYTLRFESPDRTLNDAEVAQARQTCIQAVTTTHHATLRG